MTEDNSTLKVADSRVPPELMVIHGCREGVTIRGGFIPWGDLALLRTQASAQPGRSVALAFFIHNPTNL